MNKATNNEQTTNKQRLNAFKRMKQTNTKQTTNKQQKTVFELQKSKFVKK
jgi:hypothetical protein